jgi:hypothetical protein
VPLLYPVPPGLVPRTFLARSLSFILIRCPAHLSVLPLNEFHIMFIIELILVCFNVFASPSSVFKSRAKYFPQNFPLPKYAQIKYRWFGQMLHVLNLLCILWAHSNASSWRFQIISEGVDRLPYLLIYIVVTADLWPVMSCAIGYIRET